MQRENPRSLTPINQHRRPNLGTLPGLSLPRRSQSPNQVRRRSRERSTKKPIRREYQSLNTTEVSNIHSLLNERTNKSRNRQSNSRDHYKYAVNRSKNDEHVMSSSNAKFIKKVQKRRVGKFRQSYDRVREGRKSGEGNFGNLGQKILDAKQKKLVEVVNSYGGLTDDEVLGLKIFEKFKGKIYENQSEEIRVKLKAVCARFVVEDHTMTEERFANFCKLVVNGFFAGIWMKKSEILYKPSSFNLTFARKRKNSSQKISKFHRKFSKIPIKKIQ